MSGIISELRALIDERDRRIHQLQKERDEFEKWVHEVRHERDEISKSFDEMQALANESFANGIKDGLAERDELKTENEKLKSEQANYYHDFRLKFDEQMKVKDIEIEKLRAEIAEIKTKQRKDYHETVCGQTMGCQCDFVFGQIERMKNEMSGL